KDEIFFELHNIGFTKFYEYQRSIQHISDPLARLEAHGRAYLEFALGNPEFYDIMFISLAPAKKIKLYHNWELGERTYALLKENVKQCIDAGYFSGQSVEVVAFSMWSFVHGIASLIIRQRMQLVPQEVIENITNGAMCFLINNPQGKK
ncbi:MAG: WHG domain-containing protein, partial [Ignavibacteriales bacterium]|nr:WHG domain-containing protein [Ignavibacteriales bacterium]